MAYDLGNYERDNRFELVGMGAAALCALFVPYFALQALGLDGILNWMAARSTAMQWLLMAVLWTISFVLVLGTARGVISFIGHLIPLLIAMASRLGEVVARALTALVFGGAACAGNLLTALLYPVRCGCEAVTEWLGAHAGRYVQAWRDEQELRRLYREEFRAEFGNFREFKRSFHRAGAEQADAGQAGESKRQNEKRETPPRESAPDPFKAACRLLGLAEDGAFAAADLKKRYLALIKGVHPDVAGPNELASQINAAKALIKQRKGWS